MGRDEVLDHQAKGLVERHIGIAASSRHASQQQPPDLTDNVGTIDRTLLDRNQDVARLFERRPEGVDIYAALGDEGRVRFSCGRGVRAH